MKVGGLFSGIGGFELGLTRAGMEIAWMVEINDFCQKVLKKHWPTVPIYEDIKSVTKKELTPVELICGGFPCQPFSQAGKQRGKEDDRYLWPEMLRVIRELKPRWIIGENVAGFINMELENAFTDLESEGYKVEAFILPACSVNAPHRRDRIWIVAYTHEVYRQYVGIGQEESHGTISEISNNLWNSEKRKEDWFKFSMDSGRVSPEKWRNGRSESIARPLLLRVDNGLSRRLHKNRLESLGNAVVPQIPEILGRCVRKWNLKTT